MSPGHLNRRGSAERRDRSSAWSAVTGFGWSVAVACVLAWIGAARFGWEELAVVAAAALLALLVACLYLFRNHADLMVRLELVTPRVTVGESATARVEVTNEGRRRMLPFRLETTVGRGAAYTSVPTLAAGASHDDLFVIPTTRRAIVPVGPVRSVNSDPLGLVRREMRWTERQDLYVNPKTVRVPPLTTGWMRDLEGATTNDRSPSDVAFHALREYAVGDDRRHIHWRTTARQPDGKLMVREFVDTRRAHVALLLSLRPGDYATEDEFELAISSLASLGVRSITDQQQVTCLAGQHLVPSFHRSSFLDALTGLELATRDDDLDTIAARGRERIADASVSVVVTGSGADPGSALQACQQIGATVRSAIVQASPGADSTVRMTSVAPVLQLGALEHLPKLVAAVTRS